MRRYNDINEDAYAISSTLPTMDGVQANYKESSVTQLIDHIRDTVRKYNLPETTEVSIMTERGLNPSISNVVSPKWQHRLGELSRYESTFYRVPVRKTSDRIPTLLVGYIVLDNGEAKSTNYVVNLVIKKK